MTEPTTPKNLDDIPYIIMPGAFKPRLIPLVQLDKDGTRHTVGTAVIFSDGRVITDFGGRIENQFLFGNED